MRTLREKYSKYEVVRENVVTPVNRVGVTIRCSLCGIEYTDRIDKYAIEIICPYCVVTGKKASVQPEPTSCV